MFEGKLGVSHTDLMRRLGGYGDVSAYANDKAANLSFFYGRKLGDGLSIGLFQLMEFPFEDKPKYYTELQLNKQLDKRLSLFGRIELTGFKDPVYLFGMSINLADG
ncbi:MAG TPA: hypothetical protein VFF28_03475 [Candidatus Nanoarchaeia archaeon]|nr:hypothetical protein [Candidatus Nanoarchaeia archaeon]